MSEKAKRIAYGFVIVFIGIALRSIPRQNNYDNFDMPKDAATIESGEDRVGSFVKSYDIDGRIIEEKYFKDDGENPAKEIFYDYENNGSYCVKTQTEAHKIPFSCSFYYYDKEGKNTEYYICTDYGDGNYVTNTYGKCRYNKDGLPESVTEYDVFYRGKKQEKMRTEYEYDRQGRYLKVSAYYDYTNEFDFWKKPKPQQESHKFYKDGVLDYTQYNYNDQYGNLKDSRIIPAK